MSEDAKQPEMVERVKKALLIAEGHANWDELSVRWNKTYSAMAQAAIEALRVPTEAMLEEGPPEPYMDNDVWAKMIDAALK